MTTETEWNECMAEVAKAVGPGNLAMAVGLEAEYRLGLIEAWKDPSKDKPTRERMTAVMLCKAVHQLNLTFGAYITRANRVRQAELQGRYDQLWRSFVEHGRPEYEVMVEINEQAAADGLQVAVLPTPEEMAEAAARAQKVKARKARRARAKRNGQGLGELKARLGLKEISKAEQERRLEAKLRTLRRETSAQEKGEALDALARDAEEES